MKRPASGGGFSPADQQRLDTYIVEIVLALRPGAPSSEAAEGIRNGRRGALLIRPDGSWRDYEGDDGGRGALSLIAHLLDIEQHDLNAASALQFARKWLAEHPGEGAFQVAAFDPAVADQRARQRAQWAEHVLRSLEAIQGTAADLYLNSRALYGPYPNCVSFLRNARNDESAVVGILTMPDGTLTGVQLGFIDPTGRKSALEHKRLIFNSELDSRKRRGAAFRIPAISVPAAIDEALGPAPAAEDDDEPRRLARTARQFAGTTFIAEGLEDALSLRAPFPFSAIIGLPGIGALKNQKFKPGTQVVVVPDGDSVDAAARRTLERGIDELLLQRAIVRVAPMPVKMPDGPKFDANLILTKSGLEVLQHLILAAEPAKLSLKGKVVELAKLGSLDYGQVRRATAKEYGVAAGFLDRQVQARRKVADQDKGPPQSLVQREPDPWDGPVDLGEVFDDLVELIGLLLVCTEAERFVIGVWIIHTYIAEQFTYTPRLNPLSPEPRCGKTTLVNLLTHTCYRPVVADGLTPAFFMRLRSAEGPCTVLLDEMGEALHASPELDAVLRSGFERGKTAGRLREMPDGTYVPEAFEVFNPVAIAGLRAPPTALADRCLTIRLQRKPVHVHIERLRRRTVRERAHRIADQLARWREGDGAALSDDPTTDSESALLEALTAPLERSISNDRQIDFSVPLLVIAHAMGGRRELQVRAAIERVLGADGDKSEAVGTLLLQDLLPLLDQYRREQPKITDPELRVPSAWLVAQLVALPDAPWNGEGGYRPLTQFRLSRLLRPYGVAPGFTGPKGAQSRGYRWLQLVETCQHYISRYTADTPLQGAYHHTYESYQGVNGGSQSAYQGPGNHPENDHQPVENIELYVGKHPETGELRDKHRNSSVPPSDFNSDGKDFSLHDKAETPSSAPRPSPPAGGDEGAKPNGEDLDPPPRMPTHLLDIPEEQT